MYGWGRYVKEHLPDVGSSYGELGGAAASARAAAIAAERERRRLQQTRRVAFAADGGNSDGFALRKWRRAGVFGADSVQQVEETLASVLSRVDGPRVDREATDTLRRALDGEPSKELPGALKILLAHAESSTVVQALICAHTARTLWLADWGSARMAVLLREEGSGPMLVPSGMPNGDPSGAFELFVCLATGRAAAFASRRVASVLPWIPVGVVDDLIDAGVLAASDEPWASRRSDEESLYVRARLAPEQLSVAEFERLGWLEPLQRERFLAGDDLLDGGEDDLYELLARVSEGDAGALKALESRLPRELVLRLRKIEEGAQIGTWDSDIVEDRGLWRLLASLWEPKAAVDPRRGPLYTLIALRQAYDFLISQSERRRAAAQVGKLIAYNEADDRVAAEAWNMAAYLALLDDDLNTATEALARVPGDHPSLTANRQLVRRRKVTLKNDRQPPSNPYLDLGVPHGSRVWEQRYRDLRREYLQDREVSAHANRAALRIRTAEKHEDWSDFFVLPLDRDMYDLPFDLPVTLVPPASVLPRRTVPRSAADLDVIRTQAVLDLLPSLLTTPRLPDRHTRNPA